MIACRDRRAASLFPPAWLRRGVRRGGPRRGAAGLRRPSWADLPPVARADPRPLALGVEPQLVGRLPRAPVLPSRLRVPRGPHLLRSARGVVADDGLSGAALDHLSPPRRDHLLAPGADPPQPLAGAAGGLRAPGAFRRDAEWRGRRAPVGPHRRPPGLGTSAPPRALARSLAGARGTPSIPGGALAGGDRSGPPGSPPFRSSELRAPAGLGRVQRGRSGARPAPPPSPCGPGRRLARGLGGRLAGQRTRPPGAPPAGAPAPARCRGRAGRGRA